jgi:hypothetical protein
MAEVSDKVTEALNEARILILGAEILLGFQLAAPFQSKFNDLLELSRRLDGVAYGLMLLAVILLIAPGSFHRLAESGNDTVRLQRFTTALAVAALGPFAACLGIDEFIVAGTIMGGKAAFIAGCGVTGLALVGWYAIELVRRHRYRRVDEKMEAIMRTPIKEKIKTMGTEVRVILPGAQALLGFQFAAFLSDAFGRLSDAAKFVHFASLTSMAIAVILLMAPAAYHRIATGGEDTRDVDIFGSWAMLVAMVFLGLSMTGDFYVMLGMVTGSEGLAITCAVAALVAAFALWFLYPCLVRRHGCAIG